MSLARSRALSGANDVGPAERDPLAAPVLGVIGHRARGLHAQQEPLDAGVAHLERLRGGAELFDQAVADEPLHGWKSPVSASGALRCGRPVSAP